MVRRKLNNRCRWWPLIATLALGAANIDTSAAGDLLVSSRFSDNVLRYAADTGEFRGVFAEGHGLANPNGIAIGPDGHLYIGLGDVGKVLRFHGRSGAFLNDFVFDDPDTPDDETGGLTGCRGLTFGPDGNLYVNAGPADKVIRYDGSTGALIDVVAQGQGLDGPVGIAFGPDGHLYVGAALSNAIFVYDVATRALLRTCDCTNLMSAVTGVAFGPGGGLYAASGASSRVIRFDPTTCECLGIFASGGGLSTAIYMTFDGGGDLLVASFSNDSVVKFDGQTGDPLGALVPSGRGGLDGTHDFAFLRDGELGDLNCDGQVNAFDIEPFLVALFDPDNYPGQYPDCDINLADINGDGSINAFDIEPFLNLLFP